MFPSIDGAAKWVTRSFATGPWRGFFGEAKSLVKQRADAQVDNAVVDVHAGPPGLDNPEAAQSLKLIGHSLRLHPDCIRQLRDTQLIGSHERMQKS